MHSYDSSTHCVSKRGAPKVALRATTADSTYGQHMEGAQGGNMAAVQESTSESLPTMTPRYQTEHVEAGDI